MTWPVDVNKIRFWGYGPLGVNITPEITAQTQLLKSFKVESNMVDGGVNHQDLVVTFTEATRESASGMQVPLVFNHALSQIEVNIKKGEGFEEGRVVKVKGAWIINVHSEGDLEFETSANTAEFADAESFLSWSTRTVANYGRTIEPTRLNNRIVSMLSNDAYVGDNSSLMVLPQKFVKYQFDKSTENQADAPQANISNFNNAGTYILVLCRVETEHRFDATPEGSAENPAIGKLIEGGKEVGHIHQLFPVVKDASGKLIFKADAFGYSCVPIEGEWLPGKKYVYTLEFCGKNSGAGVYPPEPLPDELPEGEKRPDDKKPGDPVLDDPITFSVTVDDWTEKTEPTPMN